MNDILFARCAALVLQKHKLSLVEEGTQVIRFVRDNSLLNQVLVIYQDKSFSLRKQPNVHFEGEEGYDAGGLTRDFFSSTINLVYVQQLCKWITCQGW